MIWRAILDLFHVPAAATVVHDPRVHEMKNAATKDLGQVEMLARQYRRMSHRLANPDDVQRKLGEAKEAYEAARLMLDDHHDPDDGLLSGMDRSLPKERGP